MPKYKNYDDEAGDVAEQCNHQGILWITFTYGPPEGPLHSYAVSAPFGKLDTEPEDIKTPELRKRVEKAIKWALSTLSDIDLLLQEEDMLELSLALKCSVCKESLWVWSLTEITAMELMIIADDEMETTEDALARMAAMEFVETYVDAAEMKTAADEYDAIVENEEPKVRAVLVHKLQFDLPRCYYRDDNGMVICWN